jgi:hypothetical protein
MLQRECSPGSSCNCSPARSTRNLVIQPPSHRLDHLACGRCAQVEAHYSLMEKFGVRVPELQHAAYRTMEDDLVALRDAMWQVEANREPYLHQFCKDIDAQVEDLHREVGADALLLGASHHSALRVALMHVMQPTCASLMDADVPTQQVCPLAISRKSSRWPRRCQATSGHPPAWRVWAWRLTPSSPHPEPWRSAARLPAACAASSPCQ